VLKLGLSELWVVDDEIDEYIYRIDRVQLNGVKLNIIYNIFNIYKLNQI